MDPACPTLLVRGQPRPIAGHNLDERRLSAFASPADHCLRGP
jgi:hypothetical protein